VFHLLANEFTGLGAGRLTLALVARRTLHCRFLRHGSYSTRMSCAICTWCSTTGRVCL
jgi:hypothetical protein